MGKSSTPSLYHSYPRPLHVTSHWPPKTLHPAPSQPEPSVPGLTSSWAASSLADPMALASLLFQSRRNWLLTLTVRWPLRVSGCHSCARWVKGEKALMKRKLWSMTPKIKEVLLFRPLHLILRRKVTGYRIFSAQGSRAKCHLLNGQIRQSLKWHYTWPGSVFSTCFSVVFSCHPM